MVWIAFLYLKHMSILVEEWLLGDGMPQRSDDGVCKPKIFIFGLFIYNGQPILNHDQHHMIINQSAIMHNYQNQDNYDHGHHNQR